MFLWTLIEFLEGQRSKCCWGGGGVMGAFLSQGKKKVYFSTYLFAIINVVCNYFSFKCSQFISFFIEAMKATFKSYTYYKPPSYHGLCINLLKQFKVDVSKHIYEKMRNSILCKRTICSNGMGLKITILELGTQDTLINTSISHVGLFVHPTNLIFEAMRQWYWTHKWTQIQALTLVNSKLVINTFSPLDLQYD
jgi:hypothetical protein